MCMLIHIQILLKILMAKHFLKCCYVILCSFSLDHGVIRNDRVFDAMLATDRALYSTDHPYADSPQSIGTHFSHTHTTVNSRWLKTKWPCIEDLYDCYSMMTFLYHRVPSNYQCTTYGEQKTCMFLDIMYLPNWGSCFHLTFVLSVDLTARTCFGAA